MSSINGVDKQPLFIPINQDPGSSNNGNESKIDDIFSGLENKIPDFANSVPDFESIFQSLLARAASQGTTYPVSGRGKRRRKICCANSGE